MLRVLTYDCTRKDEWDAFVLSNPVAWTGHLSGICDLEEESSKATTHSVMVVDDRQRILCILPLFEISRIESRLFRLRELSSGVHLRSGPLFEPKLSPRERRNVLNFLMDYVSQLANHRKVDRVIISYPNIVGDQTSLSYYGYLPIKHYGYNEENVIALIVDLGMDSDVIFNRLKEACKRQIRKCQKEGGRFDEILDRSEWLDCYDLNVQTMGELSHTRKMMEIVWDQFVARGFGTITGIRFGGKIISVMAVTGSGKSRYFWLGFNAKPHVIPGASDYLLWETMMLHKKRGVKFFEVGTMEFSTEKLKNIGRFKERFNGSAVYGLSGVLELRPCKKAIMELMKAMSRRVRKQGIEA